MIYPQPQRVRLSDKDGLITREWLRYFESVATSIPAAADTAGLQNQLNSLASSLAALSATVAAVTGIRSTSALVDVPADSFSVAQAVPFPGVLPTQNVVATLGPHLDSEENDPELLDVLAISAAAGTDLVQIEMAFATPTKGLIRLNLMAY